jgi:hypothetical protein
MNYYPSKQMSGRQSQYLLKLLKIMYDLELISESAFTNTATFFDDYTWGMHHDISSPLPQWFINGNRKRGIVDS